MMVTRCASAPRTASSASGSASATASALVISAPAHSPAATLSGLLSRTASGGAFGSATPASPSGPPPRPCLPVPVMPRGFGNSALLSDAATPVVRIRGRSPNPLRGGGASRRTGKPPTSAIETASQTWRSSSGSASATASASGQLAPWRSPAATSSGLGLADAVDGDRVYGERLDVEHSDPMTDLLGRGRQRAGAPASHREPRRRRTALQAECDAPLVVHVTESNIVPRNTASASSTLPPH